MTRNFGRTILLLVIVVALGTFISGALSVRQAISITENNLKADIPAVAVVDLDVDAMEAHEELTGEWPSLGVFTIEQAQEIGALPFVENYDISVGEFLVSEDIQRATLSGASFSEGDMGSWNSFNLRGVYSERLVEKEEGIIEITAGRMFDTEEISSMKNVVLVSRNFADANDLFIGSTFTLENIIWRDVVWDTQLFIEDNIFARRSYDFEIVGIFERLNEAASDDPSNLSNHEEIDNRIYAPNPVAIAAQTFYMENLREMIPDSPFFEGTPEGTIRFRNIYVLNSFQDMDNFREAALDVLPQFFTVKDLSDTDTFQMIAAPMETLDWLATMVLWASIAAIASILTLLLVLVVRDRRREIGILLALGEKRSRVVAQILTEVLVLVFAAAVLALFAGNVLAANISDDMLRQDLLARHQGDGARYTGHLEAWGYSTGITSPEATLLDSYDVSLDAVTTVSFFAVSIGTVIVATVLPLLYVVRLNPKKILM
jgi:putative ABC transport system permease protein